MLNVSTLSLRGTCRYCGCSRPNANQLMELLGQMQSASYKFYLTGSHYFGNSTVLSDFDFFTDESAISWLNSNGFSLERSERYNDTHCKYLLHHDLGIDVQIVDDILTKGFIQRVIKAAYLSFYNGLNKQQRKTFWDAMYLSAIGRFPNSYPIPQDIEVLHV